MNIHLFTPEITEFGEGSLIHLFIPEITEFK